MPGAASIMSSYNRCNGVLRGHHKYLLRQVLKKEWILTASVMSDFCWGVRGYRGGCPGGQGYGNDVDLVFGDRLVKAGAGRFCIRGGY